MSGEECFLVFLEVTLVTCRQAFQRREQTQQRAGDASRFSTDQLPGVGGFFLRHQAAARGIFVRKNHVRKFLRRKKYEILSKARKLRADAGERKKIVDRE